MRPTPPRPLHHAAPPPDDGREPGVDDTLPRTDPPRDPQLADALRRLDAVSPVDVERVRRAILVAASPRLAALRKPAWWEWTASWATAAIPLALAAGVAALAFALRAGNATTQQIGAEPETVTASTTTAYSPAFISVVSEPGSGSQVADAVVGPASHDWLVSQVVQP